MHTPHPSRTSQKKRKHSKKSVPPDARPTAKMPTRPARRDANEPARNWEYADANTPAGEREDNGAGEKTSAPTSIGRVYGGENNVTLPANEKAVRDSKKRH